MTQDRDDGVQNQPLMMMVGLPIALSLNFTMLH
jgi:hypothetical protein